MKLRGLDPARPVRLYDLDSHVTGTSDTSASIVKPSAAASYSTGMTYDQLNRPVGVSWSPAPSQAAPTASSVTFGYGYDATNRRVSQSATDKSWWNYPTAASSVAYTPNNLNQYGKVGSVTPTYDGNGDLTDDGSYTYCYDAESRLTGILSSGTCASPGTTVASYAYDAQGRRKSKIVGSTTTIYVTDTDNREVLEYNGSSGALGAWYSDAPAAAFGSDAVLNQMTVGGARQTLISVQGSIAATLDSGTGALTKIGYQTYGEHPSLAAGSYRYTARRYDAETAGSTAQPSGLYYDRARMYSPTWGRFLQPDPVGYLAGTNLYAYVNNNPLNLIDPLGLAADTPQGASSGLENYLSESAEALSEIPSDLAAMTPADMLGYTQSALLAIGAPTPATALGEAAEVIGAEATAAEEAGTAAGGGLTRVGRWMSQGEFDAMSDTGLVQEGAGGRTYVVNPANPAAYQSAAPGSVYSEFNVPTDSLFPAGKPEWSVIPGPNVTTRLYGPAPTSMPPATCIVCVIGGGSP